MKTLTFTYTKKDGSVSSRTLLVQSSPSDKYAGIDISDMDPNDAQNFISAMQFEYGQYLGMVKARLEVYDLKHNYRQFLPSGMNNIEEI
jgi:hypothetical protein